MMSQQPRGFRVALVSVVLGFACGLTSAAETTENFDDDPRWEGRNHRAAATAPEQVRQDFGYSPTEHAGGQAGEIGGFVSPAGEPAYYATTIPAATLDDPLVACGTFACGEAPFHVLVGLFNSETLNEWRTPNTISLRLMGRGEVFFAFVEYCTARWRAGGDRPKSFPLAPGAESGRMDLAGFGVKRPHRWRLEYDPAGNGGRGVVTAQIDDQTAICHLDDDHKTDGARFNRFGLMTVMKSADTGGELWLDDVEVNGQLHDFARDPGWESVGNRRTYTSTIVRPRCDFGFSRTRFAGGRGRGELGGLVFRGDCRYPEKMAYYADRLEPLSLDRPFRAAGKVCLRRGVSDSTVLFGFFNSQDSMRSNPAQDSGLPASFAGISTDGPSRDGFCFSPTYRVGAHSAFVSSTAARPPIYPDGESHDWTFDYDPAAAEGNGAIMVTLGNKSVELQLARGARGSGVRFDRFGLITTWIDGNSQTIYFDDLTYTHRQE